MLSISEARKIIIKREWDNRKQLSKHLLSPSEGSQITLGLKPPSSFQVNDNLPGVTSWIQEWRNSDFSHIIEWRKKNTRSAGEITIPAKLHINHLVELLHFLGSNYQDQIKQFARKIIPIVEINPAYEATCIHHFDDINSLSNNEIKQLVIALQSLSENMNQGLTLRMLKISGIDTKFIERNDKLIKSFISERDGINFDDYDGIEGWLGCKNKPNNWLTLVVLCPKLRKQAMNQRTFKIPSSDINALSWDATHCLIIENEQSAYNLDDTEGLFAIAGCGKNLNWLKNWDSHNIRIGYWGDLDTHGFHMLGLAKEFKPHVIPIMMNESALIRHQEYAVSEDKPITSPHPFLSHSEQHLFYHLLYSEKGRIEQELLDLDFITESIHNWIRE